MTGFTKILAAALAGAAAAIAAPAAGQPGYPPPPPPPPYGDPFGYQNPGEQILQGVIDSLLGQRYNTTDRRAVRRCSNAALAEAWDDFGPRRRGRGDRRDWRDNSQMQVVAITEVERRPTGLRVRGEIDSGLLYAQPYPGNRRHRSGDLRFRCNVDYNGRIYNVRVERNPDFRPPRPW